MGNNVLNKPIAFVVGAGRCIWRATAHTIDHDGVEHAGYLTFLGLLGVFPFLVLIFAVAGAIGAGETGAAFITETLSLLPPRLTEVLTPRILEIVSGPPQGLLTVSIIGAIWTASSAVEGLRTTLNRAYHVATLPAYWLRRSLSVLQLLVFTAIVICGIVLLIVIPLVLDSIELWLGAHFISTAEERLGHIAWIGTLLILFAAVSYIYYLIPNIRQRFITVAPGAIIAVFGWFASAYVLTLYFSNFDQVNLVYGSLGGFIAAMVFTYVCSLIFIFGAELNYQIMHALGITPAQREAAGASVSCQ